MPKFELVVLTKMGTEEHGVFPFYFESRKEAERFIKGSIRIELVNLFFPEGPKSWLIKVRKKRKSIPEILKKCMILKIPKFFSEKVMVEVTFTDLRLQQEDLLSIMLYDVTQGILEKMKIKPSSTFTFIVNSGHSIAIIYQMDSKLKPLKSGQCSVEMLPL